jgi:hypothetical protein
MDAVPPEVPPVDLPGLREAVLQTEDDARLASHFHIPAIFVRCVRRQVLTDLLSSDFRVSLINPAFKMDVPFHCAVTQHFAHIRGRATADLFCCGSPTQFVRNLLNALVVWIQTNVPTDPYFMHRFISAFFSLPFGQSWAQTFVCVFRAVIMETQHAPSMLASELQVLIGILTPLAAALNPDASSDPPLRSPPVLSVQYEVVASRPPAVDPARNHRYQVAARVRVALDSFKLQLAHLHRQMDEISAHEAANRLVMGRLRARLREPSSNRPIPIRPEKPIGPPTIQQYVTATLLERASDSLYGHAIDSILEQVAFVLRSYSQTAYEFLRRYLPLPDQSTLYRHYHNEITEMESFLSDVGSLRQILDGQFQRGRDQKGNLVYVTLAIDAISLDSAFRTNRPREQVPQPPTHAFVFHCLPLTDEYQCFPVHVMSATCGTAGEVIIKQALDITHWMETPISHSPQVLFIATDGDRSYDKHFLDQFKKWYSFDSIMELAFVSERIWRLRPIFLSDWLHLAKTVRTYLLKYCPILFYGDNLVAVRWQEMARVLDLGDVFADRTSTGKMRDAYPIALFRLEHVLTLFENGLYGEALYLLPWALVFRAILSDKMSFQGRRYTLDVAFLIFVYFEQACRPAEKRKNDFFRFPVTWPPDVELPEQGAPGSEVNPLRWITLVRAMTTVAGLVCALDHLNCDIPLDRISTHPLENFFGLLRRLLHDCNLFTELLHAAARNCVVQRVMKRLCHPRDICGRANTGGIVARKAGAVHCVPRQPPAYTFEGILYSLETPALIDQPGNEAKLLQLIDAFDWIVDLHNETDTPWVRHGERFLIRAGSNSKIMASFLQRRT